MTKNELKEMLHANPGYLKSGSKTLAKRFSISRRYAKAAVREVHLELANPIPPFRRLFFDIETSPNLGWFWRTSWKTNITPSQILEERRVISVSWKWEGEATVHHLEWDSNKCDKTLLTEFTKVLVQADEAVAHNGDRFDIPWLRTRCIIHKLPFPTYIKSLDTLKKVRASFDFQSNTLNYIANVLGFGTKKPTGGSSLWTDLTFNCSTDSPKYKAQMSIMHEYCDFDVVLLEDVYHAIQSYIKPVSHVGISLGKGRHSCPNCGKEESKYLGHTVTASGMIKRQMRCECGSDYIISNSVFLKEFN